MRTSPITRYIDAAEALDASILWRISGSEVNQNPIAFEPTADDLVAVASALSALESHFLEQPGLRPRERQRLVKMGPKSEAFCRQAVVAFVQNPDVLTRNFDVDQFQRQMANFDVLRSLVVRTSRLFEKMRDTEIQMGSSVMRASLEGYAVLKVAGQGKGLEEIRAAMSERFARRRSGDKVGVAGAASRSDGSESADS